jgi:hypothetical protein
MFAPAEAELAIRRKEYSDYSVRQSMQVVPLLIVLMWDCHLALFSRLIMIGGRQSGLGVQRLPGAPYALKDRYDPHRKLPTSIKTTLRHTSWPSADCVLEALEQELEEVNQHKSKREMLLDQVLLSFLQRVCSNDAVTCPSLTRRRLTTVVKILFTRSLSMLS